MGSTLDHILRDMSHVTMDTKPKDGSTSRVTRKSSQALAPRSGPSSLGNSFFSCTSCTGHLPIKGSGLEVRSASRMPRV